MMFLCEYVLAGMPEQRIVQAESSIDCVLLLAEDGATAIRVQPMANDGSN